MQLLLTQMNMMMRLMPAHWQYGPQIKCRMNWLAVDGVLFHHMDGTDMDLLSVNVGQGEGTVLDGPIGQLRRQQGVVALCREPVREGEVGRSRPFRVGVVVDGEGQLFPRGVVGVEMTLLELRPLGLLSTCCLALAVSGETAAERYAAYLARGMKTPETSKFFQRHENPQSHVVSWIIKPGLTAHNQQSFYFTTKSMTDDGRFLMFHRVNDELDRKVTHAKYR